MPDISPAVRVARNKLAIRVLVATIQAHTADADAKTAVAHAFAIADEVVDRTRAQDDVDDAMAESK